jgi:K+-sensing histidine kinase KdpD
MSERQHSVIFDFPALLANCLHDVKSSLCIVLGMLEEVVSETGEDDPRYERLLKAQYEGRCISNDMTQLLGIYRSNTEKLSLHIDEVEVADFLMEQILSHHVMLDHKRIHAEVECDPALVWFFDQRMVAGIFNNVLNNAYKYTHHDLLMIGEERDSGLLLSIKDDGPGYPSHMLADSRGGLPPLDFNSGSTGLGLYFASLVASLHKNKGKVGYVRISNDGIHGGGCFSLWLP